MTTLGRALAAASLAAGCGGPEVDVKQAPEAAQPERVRVLGPFLTAHWQLPIAAQGPAPADFAPVEAALDPQSCGSCHPEQLADWSRSLHAGAYSPGFSGQLIEGSLAQPAEVRACQTCHAPLAEQQPWDASGAPQPGYEPELRAAGLVCAACHVRAHRRFGPPRRAGLPPLPARPLHGGFAERPEFEEGRFCAPCHQFFDDAGVAGKPVENTWNEWRESPQAAAGRTCQSCHMPDRRHLWLGIHDPETVRAAVDVALAPGSGPETSVSAALVVANRDVGHAFPTYVTPRVFLAVWQADAAGDEIAGTRLEATVGREIDFAADPPREVFDTRILPGESLKLDYAKPRAPGAAALVGRVTVDPDYHYRGVFKSLLASLEDANARARIAEAHRRTTESSYVLAEERRPIERP